MDELMTDMTVNALNVDLLQDSASISLFKPDSAQTPGKAGATGIHIQVPIATPGNQPENKLKQIAIEAARKALHEALETLDKHRF